MVQRRHVEDWDRFDGGLVLSASNRSARQHESPDCLNMDPVPNSGFKLRGGFETKANDLDMVEATFICDSGLTANPVLMQGANGELFHYTGGAVTDQVNAITDDVTYRVEGVPYGDASTVGANNIYLSNGRLSSAIIMQKWDGATLTTLTNTFNDNYTAPAHSDDMPLARHIAFHSGYMFVADTVESAVRYPNRLRFSHLEAPEDWATADWIYVGAPNVADPITALVPYEEALLIFKKSSVWALYGQSKDQFVLERLAGVGGVSSPDGVAVTPQAIFWYSSGGKLLSYKQGKVYDLGRNIQFWAENGKIDAGGEHSLMFADNRLWLSLAAGSSQGVDHWLFVYYPATYAFTRYDIAAHDMHSWVVGGSNDRALFVFDGDVNVYEFDETATVDVDNVGTNRIDGYFTTAWFATETDAVKKRWKRPHLTAAADSDLTLRVRIFKDFNNAAIYRDQTIAMTAATVEGIWGTMDWGEDWYQPGEGEYKFTRLPSSGSAHAIQYKFSSADNAGRWWVDSLTIPYRTKDVK